jgi:hypothetical protein
MALNVYASLSNSPPREDGDLFEASQEGLGNGNSGADAGTTDASTPHSSTPPSPQTDQSLPPDPMLTYGAAEFVARGGVIVYRENGYSGNDGAGNSAATQSSKPGTTLQANRYALTNGHRADAPLAKNSEDYGGSDSYGGSDDEDGFGGSDAGHGGSTGGSGWSGGDSGSDGNDFGTPSWATPSSPSAESGTADLGTSNGSGSSPVGYEYRGPGDFDGGGDSYGGENEADSANEPPSTTTYPDVTCAAQLPVTTNEDGQQVSQMGTIQVTASRSAGGSPAYQDAGNHGGSPSDYLSVDNFGLGPRAIEYGSRESLPPIENLYTPFEGHFASGYRTAVAGMTNPNASWDERIINGVLAAAVSPLAVIDMIGEGFINAPNAAGRAGQLFARGNVAGNADTRVISNLAGIVEMTHAFNGAVGPFAGVVGVPPRVMTVQEQALQRFPGAEAVRAARATYGALESTTVARTLANIEGRFATASREIGFVVDARNGQILGVTRSGLDSTTQIRLNPQTDFPLMSGNIFTHNHPLGGTFSVDDVAVALGSATAEFRAVTPTRIMSLTFDNPPANLLGKPESAVVFMMDEQAAIIASYQARVAEGSLIPPTDLASRLIYQSEYLMEQLVERNPWIRYTIEPR